MSAFGFMRAPASAPKEAPRGMPYQDSEPSVLWEPAQISSMAAASPAVRQSVLLPGLQTSAVALYLRGW